MSTQTIIAQQVYPPNSGKKFGRVLTPDKTAYMGTASILAGIQPRSTIVVDLEEQTWGDKKVQVIKRVVQAAPVPAPGAALEDRGGVPPHVSNWVAHAIAAGLVRSPEALCVWAQWAYEAGRSMTTRPPQGQPPNPRQATPVYNDAGRLGHIEQPDPFDADRPPPF